MLKRVGGYLTSRSPEDSPSSSLELETRGFVTLRQVFTSEEVSELIEDINRVFTEYQRDARAAQRPAAEDEMFRYEMLNRSAVCQQAIGHPKILAVIEPLIGEDCHVIANTAWRNKANHKDAHGGQGWHIDAGPHVPLAEGLSWPGDIPHPVFAIGTHIFLKDCNAEDGPTGVIPMSHLSGRTPPADRRMDDDLEFKGNKAETMITKAGDVSLFVSDVWHRRMPTGEKDSGRFFLQVHYGRRDIAQRIKTTAEVNHLSDAAIGRAAEQRQKTLIGLHNNYFYDG